jgi:simple sugar transport system permease protein
VRRFTPQLLVALATAALALALLQWQGLAPTKALPLLARGAFGDANAWSATLRGFTPLLLASLGVLLCFRVGLWNIGAEGQLVVGALAAVAAAQCCSHWTAALVAGAIAGAAWAAIPAWLSVARGVPEVLATLMLNVVAIELLRWLVSGPLQEPTHQFPQTATIADSARMPGGIEGALVLAALLTVVIGLALARTRVGLALRAGAQSPRLAQASGWPLHRARVAAFALGGACAGLAGAVEVVAIAGKVDRSLAHNLGYAAVASALLAGLDARWLAPASLLFAALATGTSSLQWAENLPGVDRFALLLQGVVILAVLVSLRLRARARADGGGA